MRAADFFIAETAKTLDPDPWDPEFTTFERFNVELIDQLRRGPIQGSDDLSAAIGLAQLVDDELRAYGTDSSQRLDDAEIAAAILALRAVLRRLGVEFPLPFRNFTGWRTYWGQNDGYGSWQKRRDLLAEFFEPLHTRLINMEEAALEGLAEPVSPRRTTGWPAVDEEVSELKRRFRSAMTPQDHRAIGSHCMGVLEALSATVYDPAKHLRSDETPPPIDKSKQRIGRYVEDSLVGPSNAELRKLVNATIEFAQAVKHGSADTRREAGIAADAVILLANMLKRLEQEF